jgi:HD superfamily phosphohydrolase
MEGSRMSEGYKTVHDTVHGSIKLEGVLLELLETPEIQRLHAIHQLGLAYLVFPGANHTRIEHSLGTGHIAGRMARELGLDKRETDDINVAGMLHDIGHGPYSHTLEYLYHQLNGKDHMEITKGIITGDIDIFEGADQEVLGEGREGNRVPDILERHGLDPKRVAGLVAGPLPGEDGSLEVFTTARTAQAVFCSKRYLHQCIHGPMDADQIDFLLRDAHYTGVAHGVLDVDRLLQTLAIHNNELVVDKGGINAVEGMMVARALMYSSVYFHKTVRIAEIMLSRAVERLKATEEEMEAIPRMVDMDLLKFIEDRGGFPARIVKALRFRRLYKAAYTASKEDLEEGQLEALKELSDIKRRRAKEDEICRRIEAPEGSVAIDVPAKEVALAEPRMHKTGILILDGERLRPLDRFTPLAKALEHRSVPSWTVMVSCERMHRKSVERMAPKVIFQ